MFRKILCVLLIGVMVCGFSGCGNFDKNIKGVDDTKQNVTSESREVAEEQKETPVEESITVEQEEIASVEDETETNKPVEYEVVPANCVYETSEGEKLTSGDAMPLKPTFGDLFTTSYYVYEYGYLEEEDGLYPEYIEGWNVTVRSPGYGEYEEILSSINGAPVVFMIQTFAECSYMEKSPEIPDSVRVMHATFYRCRGLKEAPVIPDEVTNMSYAFYCCESLETAPVIPDSVTCLDYTFVNCVSLTTAPQIPDSVTDMNYTFYDCTELTTVAKIPSGVTGMNYAFAGCSSLTDEMVFNANPTSYEGCFSEVDFISQNFTISGITSLYKELRETRKTQRPSTFF